MNKSINYRQASVCYLIGNLFNKGMTFLTVPIFTRLLSTSDYGITTTYHSWIAILSMIMGFALHMGIRSAYIDYKDNFEEFTSVTLFFTVISSAVFSMIVLAVSLLANVGPVVILIVLCLLQSFSCAVIQDYNYYLMMRYRYRLRTALMILPNLISTVISVWVIIYLLDSRLYLGRILPMALVYFIFAVIILVIAVGKVKWNKDYLKYGLTISAPLIFHGIALNILSQSDRTMITLLADASQTGIYSLIYNFGMIATVIISALEGSWVPWFMEKMHSGRIKDINRLAVDYVKLITCSMVLLVLAAPEIVKVMTPEPYWEGIKIIPPVVLANYIVFLYTLYVNVEHFHKKTIRITVNTLLAAVCNLVLNFIFIPRFGYAAAAVTTFVSYFAAFALHSRFARKCEPDIFPLKMFIIPIIHILAASVLFYLLSDMGALRWGILAAYAAVMLWKERKRMGPLGGGRFQ